MSRKQVRRVRRSRDRCNRAMTAQKNHPSNLVLTGDLLGSGSRPGLGLPVFFMGTAARVRCRSTFSELRSPCGETPDEEDSMSNYVEVRKVTSGKKTDLSRLPNLTDFRNSSRMRRVGGIRRPSGREITIGSNEEGTAFPFERFIGAHSEYTRLAEINP